MSFVFTLIFPSYFKFLICFPCIKGNNASGNNDSSNGLSGQNQHWIQTNSISYIKRLSQLNRI